MTIPRGSLTSEEVLEPLFSGPVRQDFAGPEAALDLL
jgi:hypothetical protein